MRPVAILPEPLETRTRQMPTKNGQVPFVIEEYAMPNPSCRRGVFKLDGSTIGHATRTLGGGWRLSGAVKERTDQEAVRALLQAGIRVAQRERARAEAALARATALLKSLR